MTVFPVRPKVMPCLLLGKGYQNEQPGFGFARRSFDVYHVLMRRILGRFKAAFDWVGSIYTVLGLFGGTAIVSGIAASVGGAVWAAVTGVPTPIVLMAAFCTVTAGVYLAIAPLAYRALSRISAIAATDLGSTIENKPDIEVWRHKEEFYLYEAACLFADVRPSPNMVHGSNAHAWYGALTTALNKREIRRVESAQDNARGYSHGQYHPHSYTLISKEDLIKFADGRDQRPRFLFPDQR
jgi:hypothetical protein